MKQTFKFVIFHDEVRRVEDWRRVGEKIQFAYMRNPLTPIVRTSPADAIQYQPLRIGHTSRTVHAISISWGIPFPQERRDDWSFLSERLWIKYVQPRHVLHKLEQNVKTAKHELTNLNNRARQIEERIENLKMDCNGRNAAERLIELVRKLDKITHAINSKECELEGMKRELTVCCICARAMPLTFGTKEEK